MRDLALPISERLGERIRERSGSDPLLERLANGVATELYDIEQLITFLHDAPSAHLRQVSGLLREVFEEVLRARLKAIEAECGEPPVDLYACLLDMHLIKDSREDLTAILTINYDLYLEEAIEKHLGGAVDYGIAIGSQHPGRPSWALYKLHGSFGWQDAWPVGAYLTDSLWIPPGIQKSKSAYPFNILWGKAREALQCDILRIVGCNLGGNDWDLVSLLFASQHATGGADSSCLIEVIDRPSQAEAIKARLPYLNVRSILEIEHIGEQLIAEVLGGEPRRFEDLPRNQRQELINAADRAISNPFSDWIHRKAEQLLVELGTLKTEHNLISRLLEA